MEEKNYRKVLSGNYMAQNMKALKLVVEYGRLNFLDDNFCKEMKKNIKKGHYEKEYYTEIIDIAKDIAKMSLYDMYELMEDKMSILKMTEPKEVDESHQKAKKKDKNKEAR